MWRGLHGGDQRLAGLPALETAKLIRRHDHDRIAPVHGDMLGPSLRARRTSSLKRALASCNSQWPCGCVGVVRERPGDLPILVMLTRLWELAIGLQWRLLPAAGWAGLSALAGGPGLTIYHAR